MVEDWKTYTLEELTTKLGDGLHGTPKYIENGDIFFINGNNLSDGKINIKSDTKTVSVEEFEKYKKDLNNRTLLVSINGTIGNVAEYNGEKVILGKSACYFNVKNEVDKIFIKQVISSPYFINYLEATYTGSVIKNVSLRAMRDFPILLPPLPEQKAIASILAALDDKIELNLAMNKTLEEMAMVLYKYWFVDFGPFQDGEFVESELGLIPEGWEVKSIGDLVLLTGGYAFKGKDFIEEGEKVIKIKNIDGQIVSLDGVGCISEAIAVKTNEKFIIPPGSFLIAMTGAKVGKVGILPDYKERVWLNQRVAMITEPKFPNADILVGNFMQSGECYAIIQNLAYGSAQPNISTTGLESIPLAWPIKIDVIDRVLEEISDWHMQKLSNINENITLTTLRDTLLPKLISGEVRVKDVEHQIAEAL